MGPNTHDPTPAQGDEGRTKAYDEGWKDGWAARSEAAKNDSLLHSASEVSGDDEGTDAQSHAMNRVLKGVNERLAAENERLRTALRKIMVHPKGLATKQFEVACEALGLPAPRATPTRPELDEGGIEAAADGYLAAMAQETGTALDLTDVIWDAFRIGIRAAIAAYLEATK